MTSYHLLSKSAAAQPQGSWLQRNVIDNPWIEGVAGLSTLIPGAGAIANGAWQGIRSGYHASQGNYGKAAEAAGWGAAGFVPGGAVMRGAKVGLGAARGVPAGVGLLQGARLANTAARAAAITATGAKGFGGIGGIARQLGTGALDYGAAPGIGAMLPNATSAVTNPPGFNWQEATRTGPQRSWNMPRDTQPGFNWQEATRTGPQRSWNMPRDTQPGFNWQEATRTGPQGSWNMPQQPSNPNNYYTALRSHNWGLAGNPR